MTDSTEQNGAGNRGLTIAVIVVIVLALLGLGARRMGWLGGGGQANAAGMMGGEMPPMPLDLDSARLGTVTDAIRATGRIEAIQAVELRPDAQGRVIELLFTEGQTVAEGAPLVRIDAALLEAQAERAAADHELARQQLERVRRLRADNAASPADLERAEASAQSAEAALNVLRIQIARSSVRAPFAGVVGQRFVSVGDYVTSASPLLTLQTTDPQHAVIEVPERYAGDLRIGQVVEFTVAAQAGRTFRAVVEFIDPVVQARTRTIVVKARAPNPGRLLKAGMFIESEVAIGERSAVIVPEDAIQSLRTGNVAWAIVDGRASRRVVELGTRWRGMVEIVSGVRAGELVVVGGLERLAEGMAVVPRPRGPAVDSVAGPGS